jgi:hypothetical protein
MATIVIACGRGVVSPRWYSPLLPATTRSRLPEIPRAGRTVGGAPASSPEAGRNNRAADDRPVTCCHHERMSDEQDVLTRGFGIVMLAEAATLGIASYLHRDGHIALGFTVITGEHFTAASTPEAIIGGVLAAGAAFVLAAPRRARKIAVGTTGFALLGVIVGIAAVLGSSRPDITADLTYHAILLAALLATFVLLLLLRGPRAPAGPGGTSMPAERGGHGSYRVRSR